MRALPLALLALACGAPEVPRTPLPEAGPFVFRSVTRIRLPEPSVRGPLDPEALADVAFASRQAFADCEEGELELGFTLDPSGSTSRHDGAPCLRDGVQRIRWPRPPATVAVRLRATVAPLDRALVVEPTTARPGAVEDLRDRVAALRDALGACHERALGDRPHLSGRLVPVLSIGPEGEVAVARVLSATRGTEVLERCVLQALRRLEVPPPGVVTELTTPLTFLVADP
jgi:hypothetical protein